MSEGSFAHESFVFILLQHLSVVVVVVLVRSRFFLSAPDKLVSQTPSDPSSLIAQGSV